MNGKTTQGRRVYVTEGNGPMKFAEGDYGYDPANQRWFARAPGCHLGDLSSHEIVEHEDGTITVSPSILHTEWDDGTEKTWHGYLERGVWREV